MANKFRDIPAATELLEEPKELVKEKTTAKVQKVQKPRKKGVLAKGLSSVFSGSFLTNEKTIQHLPYLLFMALVAIFYIANGYYADDKIREENRVSNQLKELRSEYISIISELMFESKQSEVAKAVESMGLKEPVVPPVKIEVDSVQLYSIKK